MRANTTTATNTPEMRATPDQQPVQAAREENDASCADDVVCLDSDDDDNDDSGGEVVCLDSEESDGVENSTESSFESSVEPPAWTVPQQQHPSSLSRSLLSPLQSLSQLLPLTLDELGDLNDLSEPSGPSGLALAADDARDGTLSDLDINTDTATAPARDCPLCGDTIDAIGSRDVHLLTCFGHYVESYTQRQLLSTSGYDDDTLLPAWHVPAPSFASVASSGAPLSTQQSGRVALWPRESQALFMSQLSTQQHGMETQQYPASTQTALSTRTVIPTQSTTQPRHAQPRGDSATTADDYLQPVEKCPACHERWPSRARTTAARLVHLRKCARSRDIAVYRVVTWLRIAKGLPAWTLSQQHFLAQKAAELATRHGAAAGGGSGSGSGGGSASASAVRLGADVGLSQVGPAVRPVPRHHLKRTRVTVRSVQQAQHGQREQRQTRLVLRPNADASAEADSRMGVASSESENANTSSRGRSIFDMIDRPRKRPTRVVLQRTHSASSAGGASTGAISNDVDGGGAGADNAIDINGDRSGDDSGGSMQDEFIAPARRTSRMPPLAVRVSAGSATSVRSKRTATLTLDGSSVDSVDGVDGENGTASATGKRSRKQKQKQATAAVRKTEPPCLVRDPLTAQRLILQRIRAGEDFEDVLFGGCSNADKADYNVEDSDDDSGSDSSSIDNNNDNNKEHGHRIDNNAGAGVNIVTMPRSAVTTAVPGRRSLSTSNTVTAVSASSSQTSPSSSLATASQQTAPSRSGSLWRAASTPLDCAAHTSNSDDESSTDDSNTNSSDYNYSAWTLGRLRAKAASFGISDSLGRDAYEAILTRIHSAPGVPLSIPHARTKKQPAKSARSVMSAQSTKLVIATKPAKPAKLAARSASTSVMTTASRLALTSALESTSALTHTLASTSTAASKARLSLSISATTLPSAAVPRLRPPPQPAVSDSPELAASIVSFIRSQPGIHMHILLHKPVDVAAMTAALAAAGVVCTVAQVLRVLESRGVLCKQ